jgi:hypothetical protein
VLDVGFAIVLVPVLLLNPVVGLHVYVLAPLTVSVVDDPEQMPVLDEPLNVGLAFTVTEMVLEAVQPAVLVPVTV